MQNTMHRNLIECNNQKLPPNSFCLKVEMVHYEHVRDDRHGVSQNPLLVKVLAAIGVVLLA